MASYSTETVSTIPIDQQSISPEIIEGKSEDDAFQVVLEGSEDPQNFPASRKWTVVAVICSAATCVTCASSLASFTEDGVSEEFRVSHEVAILSVSLFVEGLGLGPLLMGPLSEVWGRTPIYRVSYALLVALTFPVVFAPNAEVYLVFRFVTGFCGSAFLSVAGGSVSDLFANAHVANPMALFSISPFLGPVLGPLMAGFINQNLYWKWTYRILVIWIFVEFVALCLLVPETYVPVLTTRKARVLRESTGDARHWAPLERRRTSLLSAVIVSCYKPFQLLLFDPMALLLDTWTALVLGILYLSFQAFPVIFEEGHGFNMQSTGLTFLGIGVGMILAWSSQPYWNRLFARENAIYKGNPPPEVRLVMGQLGGILIPIGLFWLAFTTYPHVHWIVPIIASIPFGAGIYFCFTSVFTYLVVAYRPIAASAMAANSALRSSFAAGFPLFSEAMYNKLGTVGATALLAGLATIMAPLPFIFRHYGHKLRQRSRFAAK